MRRSRRWLPGLLAVLAFSGSSIAAPQFVPVQGPLADTPADSRSVNVIDLNRDGWQDLYISNGKKGGQPDLLYLNDGTGKLVPVDDNDILKASNPSDGASFGDINNDGHLDAVISSWYGAEDLYYLNDGQGNLVRQADAGIASGSFAETAALGDFDQDGWLDIYITNSGKSKKNYLYRNLGDGRFEAIKDHILLGDESSRAAIWRDVNQDGVPDLLVTNEGDAVSSLYLGLGDGRFIGLTSGPMGTDAGSWMTASWADVDLDGDPDLFLGSAGYYKGTRDQLYLNNLDGAGTFERAPVGPVTTGEYCTFGSAFADYDNDGDEDLAVSRGFCNTGLADALYENQGDGTFRDVSELIATGEDVCSFGLAWGDFDNNGFQDLAIAHCRNTPDVPEPGNTVLMNQGNNNSWLKVALRGNGSNATGIGARIYVTAQLNGRDRVQTREVSAQTGYAGQNSMVAHFGLADADRVQEVRVIWPSGRTQVLSDIAVRQQLVIEEES